MLVVDAVRRRFGSVEAVRDVSFSCERGSVLGLLGPNGAGKTTTMRMILGIYPPDAGSVTWDGKPVDKHVRRRFGYLPEERGLYAKMKVREQIAYFGRLHGVDERVARERANEWIATLGLEAYAARSCGELSKGNQQKVQLACAVLHEPELLVLDEPFSGLDPINAETLLACLERIAAAGTALVLSSHQMWQIEHACRTFCIIAGGQVRASGTLEELRRAFPTRLVRVAPDGPALRALFAARGSPEPERDATGALVYELPAGTDFGALLRETVGAAPIDTFERQEPSLSAVYVRAIGNGTAQAAA